LSAKAAQALLLSAELESRRTERIVRVFEQSERTLFLQFSQYRLCEAFNNGMFNSTNNGGARRRAMAMYLDADRFISKLVQAKHDVLSQVVADNLRQKESVDSDLKRVNTLLIDRQAELAKLPQQKRSPEQEARWKALNAELEKRTIEKTKLEEQSKTFSEAIAEIKKFDPMAVRERMLEPYKGLLNSPQEDPYEAAFDNIMNVARLMAEERPVLEAQLATSQAEAKAKEAAESAAKATEKAKAAEAKVSSLEKELKEISTKVSDAERAKAEAQRDAYKACTESKTCTPK
jgi:predicted  nucleic acid-binding Zn-ribbon protein